MTAIDDIKSRIDILELVSGRVALQRAGRAYKANCPFHQERTPSFYVFPERQSWRCFGACATGGDAFSFLMKADNLEFGEVLKNLARQTGVTLPTQRRRTEQEDAFTINEAAKDFFKSRLASTAGAPARQYLADRGLEPLTIEKFELGLSPRDGEALKDHLVRQGYSLEQLAQAGLVSGGDNGRYRDLFRYRLMIPIRNSQGELAGFGGRALEDTNPKYLNSPRTPVFDKGRIAYAMYLARESARREGIVVVEGYMDAIMAHQHGFENVVASMGTALTEHQVAEIRRVTGNITMALDADAAGQQATLRSLESSWKVFQAPATGRARSASLFQRQEMADLKVAALPEGQDPDEVIRESPERWATLIENARPLFEFVLPALSAQVDISTPQGKAWVSQRLFNFIAAVPEPIQQDYYFQMLAHHLQIGEDTLRASMSRFTSQARNGVAGGARRANQPGGQSPEEADSAFAKLANDPIEDHFLARILQNTELYQGPPQVRPEYFKRPENREILGHILYVQSDGFDESAIEWLRQTVDEELSQHLDYLFNKELPSVELRPGRSEVAQTAHRLEERYLRDMKVEEAMRFSETEADGAFEEADLRVLEINQLLKKNEEVRGCLVPNTAEGR